MKVHTSDFKNQVKEFGREIDSIITYELDGQTINLGNEELMSVTSVYEGGLLKSVMKQLEINSKVDISKGTILNYQFGVKVRDNNVQDYRLNYDYVDFGNYIVEKSEKQEDTKSYKITCYDKMLYAMKDFERLMEYVLTTDTTFTENKVYYSSPGVEYTGATTGNPQSLGLYEYVPVQFPITIRNYIIKLCNAIGLDFANENDNFTNYNKEITKELYLADDGTSLDYTYRDVLDELAQVTASTICINNDDELEIRYINDTEGKNLFDANYYYNDDIYSPGTYKYTKAKFKGNRTLYFKATLKEGKTAQNGIYIALSESGGSPYVSGTKSAYAISNGNATTGSNAFENVETLYINIYPNNADISRIFENYNLLVSTNNINYVPFSYDIIDEEYLKDINVNFGEKYGPVNSIVFSRSADSDSIYRKDDASIEQNGLCELRISDNQILNDDNRDDFIDGVFDKLKGLEYYINDYSSTGICYYELCDKYNVSIDGNFYDCIMLNDEINVTQGLEELVHTDLLEESETDYKKADKTDRNFIRTSLIVDKQAHTITALVGTTQVLDPENSEYIGTKIQQSVNSIIQSVSDRIDAVNDDLQDQIDDVKDTVPEKVKNTLVEIDINGVHVKTNLSRIETLIDNTQFAITDSGNEKLAWFGYDETKNESIAQMANLTVTKYFIAGNHRVETYGDNEERTGWFYVGSDS